jgi:hypothetical protein
MSHSPVEPSQRSSVIDSAESSDQALRLREVLVKEAELHLKQQEAAITAWKKPLVLAILGATFAGFGHVYATLRTVELEDRKAEQQRILEAIKTGNVDKAAENLSFLLEAGLVSSEPTVTRLRAHLQARKPGSGPVLPSEISWNTTVPAYNGSTSYVEVQSRRSASAGTGR